MSAPEGSIIRRDRRRPTRLVASVVAAAAMTVGLVATSVVSVQAAPPTSDPATAAEYGARWMATQFGPDGFVPGPNISATLEGALALASAGVEEDTFSLAMSWLQDNAATVIDGGADGNNSGRIGYLLLLADAAGIDPTSFGGLDLPSLLLATQGAEEPGLFGGADPTYDGVLRQSIAILGLVASDTTVPGTASTWLADQQCDAAVPAAAGGWEDYRADLLAPCSVPDPNNFDNPGPESNATAFAVQAMVATGLLGGADAALDFLEVAQADDGGFAFIPGGEVDPNSTALVIQAIIAGGEDPAAGRWSDGAANPVTSLLSWQVGCEAAAADQGAFASPFSDGFPDAFATRQAVWGASGRAFPLDGPVTFAAGPVPCDAPQPTTTTTEGPGTATTTAEGAPATTAPSAVARPVTAQPRLAG